MGACSDHIDDPLPPPLKVVPVAAAVLVDRDGRVLLAQRPEGKALAGTWEFPGGKIENGETPEAALVRELHEELGIETGISCLAPLTFVSHRYEEFGAHLLMMVFVCRVWRGHVDPRENQQVAWVYPRDFRNYAMPPADLPLIPVIQDLL
jgi:8-oxo-dGTP diphosphatase